MSAVPTWLVFLKMAVDGFEAKSDRRALRS